MRNRCMNAGGGIPVRPVALPVLASSLSTLLLAIGFAHADSAVEPPAASQAVAETAVRYQATSKRRFDDVVYWSKVFDDPKRDEWQQPGAIVDALEIRRGDGVADLGAGTGYFIPYLVDAVGTGGTVFAVEIEPNLVAHLRDRAEISKARNVVPVLASHDDARLPDGGLDLVLIVDTFHHLDDRRTYLDRLRRDLSERGRIAVVDWKKEKLPEGPGVDHKIAREQVVEEFRTAGFREIAIEIELPYHYVLVFEPI